MRFHFLARRGTHATEGVELAGAASHFYRKVRLQPLLDLAGLGLLLLAAKFGREIDALLGTQRLLELRDFGGRGCLYVAS